MRRIEIFNKLVKQKAILETRYGYKVAFIALYGSQNYGLDIYTDEYQSDVDMKAVIVPTLNDLVYNSKPVSEVVETEWGQCDVKDIRTYFEVLLKANPAYIETLFTEYFIVDDDFVDEVSDILSLRDDLVHTLRAQFIRAMYGMMCEKEKALTHPYPSIVWKIEKWGCDGKQASHCLRLFLMMYDYYVSGMNLADCMKPHAVFHETLFELKLNKYTLDEVKKFVAMAMERGKKLKDDILANIDESTIDYSIKDKFTKLSQQIIRNKIIAEIALL